MVVFEGLHERLQQPHSKFGLIGYGSRVEGQQVQGMPYGLVGIEQVALYILLQVAEQLLAAAENDLGGLLIVENTQHNTQQEQQKCKHRTNVNMQRELTLPGLRNIAHEQLLRNRFTCRCL